MILWPLIKIGWRIYYIQRQMKQAYRAAAGQSGRQSSRANRESDPSKRKGGWSAGHPSKKIIDKNEGEYVAFEEVTVTSTTEYTATSESGDKVSVEITSQVSDAEWEEIR